MANGRLQASALILPCFPLSSQSLRLPAVIVAGVVVTASSQKSSTTEISNFTTLQFLLVLF